MANLDACAQSSMNGARALVVGAGIVGTCCAIYLRRTGFNVTLVERDAPGESCSFGNAGSIGLSSYLPTSLPGLIWKVPRMIVDARSPLQVNRSRLVRSLPWFLRFLQAGRPGRVERIIAARKALLDRVLEAFEPILAESGTEPLIKVRGKLVVYGGEQSYRADALDHAVRRESGVRFDELTGNETRQREPALGERARRSIFLPDLRHCVNPLRLTQSLVRHFVDRGGHLVRETVRGFQFEPDGTVRVLLDAGTREADVVVIAAGIWSRSLAASLGIKVPLESQRGYHAMLPEPGIRLHQPVLWSNRKVIITPMEHGVRVSGIAEHAGLDAPPNYRLADLVVEHARELIPGLRCEGASRWMGHRPATPDSLPVIGRAPKHPSVLLAFGHGHTGLTLAAVTGKLIAEMAANRPTTVDIEPYSPERF